MPGRTVWDVELSRCIGTVQAIKAKRIEVKESRRALKEPEARRIQRADVIVISFAPGQPSQTFDNSCRVKSNSPQGSDQLSVHIAQNRRAWLQMEK